ncbi:hypothetical protein ILUMI_23825 [Ignelater luminosus]|uniref:Cyclin-dependent kinase inhibitor domain-containing protein n=1 Tax=Ignelater luminosus TaxID=2038154 RepID=A0A8K0CBP4_IGNLU|nr:hypothetical protein ILUMI_23825 [Ignelater luminosus]
MSTRVFKPISVSELSKIRSSPILEGRLAYKGVQKVRRALFHPNPEDTKRFLKEEFAKLATFECDKWDFDFVEGQPKQIRGRYEWTLITEKPKLDVMMAPIKRLLNVQDTTEELYPPIQSSSENTIEDTEMSTSDVPFAVEIPKKQSLITDFMQVRKRIEERPLKRLDCNTSRPQKKARMSLVDSAS